MFLLEIQTIVGCNMLDKLVELCKNDLVSTIVESESPKIMIPSCTSILSALVILPTSISFYKKLGLRFAYINLNVKESDRTPISSWFM